MRNFQTLEGGTKKIEDRALNIRAGKACDLRLMEDTLFIPNGKEKSGFDLYQHPEGFVILVKRDLFEVTPFKGGKITIRRKYD